MRRAKHDWEIVGAPIAVGRNQRGSIRTPLATAYAHLLERFGPGTFNDFVHLLSPDEVTTYAKRLAIANNPVLDDHAVFAISDNGDALSWSLRAGAKSPIWRFPPRSMQPRRVATGADDLLALIATKNLAFARGPIRAFFVPRRARRRWQARAQGGGPRRGGLDAWTKRCEEGGEALLLTRDVGPSRISVALLVRAHEAILKFQHLGDHQGWWALSIEARKGTPRSAFAAILASAATIGVDERVRTAFMKAKSQNVFG